LEAAETDMIAVQIEVRQENPQHTEIYKILDADDGFGELSVIHYLQL
jgi:hypothetical protein